MRFLLAATAVVVGASVIGVSAYLSDNPKPAAAKKPLRPLACDDPEGFGIERAGSVAAIFVTSTVIAEKGKRDPECSFDLVTAKLKQGKTRAQWQRSPGIQPFLIDYRESADSGLAEDVDVDGVCPDGGPYPPQNASAEVLKARNCTATSVTAILYIAGPRGLNMVSELYRIHLVLRNQKWLVDEWAPLEPGGTGQPRMTE